MAVDAAQSAPVARSPETAAEAKKRRAPLLVTIASLVVLALIGGITWAALAQRGPGGDDLDPLDPAVPPTNKAAVPTPTELTGRKSPTNENKIIFTWGTPTPKRAISICGQWWNRAMFRSKA